MPFCFKKIWIELNARSLSAVKELDGMRGSHISKWINRFRRFDLLKLLNPVFQQFVDDSYVFQNVKGYRLQPSVNLQSVEFLGYRLEFNRPGLCGVWTAPLLDIPLQQGIVGIELVSPRNKIILQQVVAVNDLRVDMPAHFVFTPIQDTEHGIWEIHVFPAKLRDQFGWWSGVSIHGVVSEGLGRTPF